MGYCVSARGALQGEQEALRVLYLDFNNPCLLYNHKKEYSLSIQCTKPSATSVKYDIKGKYLIVQLRLQ